MSTLSDHLATVLREISEKKWWRKLADPACSTRSHIDGVILTELCLQADIPDESKPDVSWCGSQLTVRLHEPGVVITGTLSGAEVSVIEDRTA